MPYCEYHTLADPASFADDLRFFFIYIYCKRFNVSRNKESFIIKIKTNDSTIRRRRDDDTTMRLRENAFPPKGIFQFPPPMSHTQFRRKI